MGFPGGSEFLIILLIVLVLFGGRKIPELAKGLGRGIKEFKKASQDDEDEKPPGEKKAAPPADKE